MANDNPFTLTFTLKQHTPLIHFQHTQAGATLRATEVKPKLDRFIIEKLTEISDDYEKAQKAFKKLHPDWLIGKGKAEHVALDYKLAIRFVETKLSEIRKGQKVPAFFANMGPEYKEGNTKGFSWADDLITCEVTCFQNYLKDIIEENFSAFLSHYNFGTRQSKGFGSFYLDPSDKNYKAPDLPYSFTVSVKAGAEWLDKASKILTNIDVFYRALRSGINIPKPATAYEFVNPRGEKEIRLKHGTDFYCKAFLFLYLKNKSNPAQWDKKSVKEAYFIGSWLRNTTGKKPFEGEKKIINRDLKLYDVQKVWVEGLSRQKLNYPHSEPLHFPAPEQSAKKGLQFRDLFGLSTTETWHSYGTNIEKKHLLHKPQTNDWEVRKEKDPERIARFKSPIWFKPIWEDKTTCRVYFSFIEPPSNYRNQRFLIDNPRKQRNASDLHLITASEDDFTFKDFFNFIFQKKNLDLSTYVESNHQSFTDPIGVHYFGILQNIFNQLQK